MGRSRTKYYNLGAPCIRWQAPANLNHQSGMAVMGGCQDPARAVPQHGPAPIWRIHQVIRHQVVRLVRYVLCGEERQTGCGVHDPATINKLTSFKKTDY